MESRELDVNGLGYYVLELGEGPAVLLLHGFPDTSYLWRRQMLALAEAGYRAIAPDLRGRGRTARPERVEGYRLANVVKDVAGLLDGLEVEKAHVVGHDWGAAVAWLSAALLPARVDRLVTISVGHPGTGGRPTLEQLQKSWYRSLFLFEGTAEDLFARDNWYLMRELLQECGGDLEHNLRLLGEPGALTAALNWYRANLPVERTLSAPRSLPPVQAPTLGIFGARDLYLTESPMRRSGEFVSAPWHYKRFEDAGHWIPGEQPQALNRLLVQFLSAADPAAPLVD